MAFFKLKRLNKQKALEKPLPEKNENYFVFELLN